MLKHQNGFTLIETLIAVLILSIGLLGMAGLQVLSLQSSNSSLSRSQATLIAYDLIERIRRNPTAAVNGQYDIITAAVNGNSILAQDCITNVCSNRQLASQDMREWLENIQDINNIGLDGANWRPVLLNASASITRVQNNFTLNILWTENDSGGRRALALSYETIFEI